MLKITTRREAGALVFQLEGKLAGPWVQELERCWRSAPGTRQSRVDLSSVTFIDAGWEGAPRSNAPGRGRVRGVGMSKQMHRRRDYSFRGKEGVMMPAA